MATAAPTADSPRERILETAAALFYAHGIHAVGVDLIIARAEVAKASFYKHFPSKQDLIVAILSRRGEAWRQGLAESVRERCAAPALRPLAVFDALGERFGQGDFRGCMFINSMVELADRGHAGHAVADDHKRRVTAYLRGLLEQAGVDPAAALAEQYMLLIDGAIVTALRIGSAAPAASARAIAERLLQHALSPGRGRRKAARPGSS
ncbi:TetR/AcrR family transcriptional regulator [Lysobacter antibioticus]|uniref:TetR/AcrR family transcriptional regulator n=1 Tax=Lysobacter antibioticus TaxID=84531 RepID=UPI00034551D1|nr:TetR/AcrR family transcriptional regulator [Lysobacter antibioticus]